jgi:hypothetical protein
METPMKKFLVLYRSTVSAKDQMMGMTSEQRNASMGEWMNWAKTTGSALADMGAPLGDSTVIKGTPGQGYIGGYSFLQADSLDAAKKLVDAHPHLQMPGASIELIEVMPMPGM